MNAYHRRSRALASVAFGLVASAALVGGPGRGQDGAQVAPPVTDLLFAPAFDLITLNDGSTLRIDPVLPRPLPPYDPAKDPSRRASKKDEGPPREGNIGLPGEPSKLARPKDEAEGASDLTVHAQEGEVRDFTVKRGSIRSIAYFEDALLAEADRLVLLREFTKAFEICLRVRSFSPNWKGLDDQVDRLLFAEGSAALLDGDGDRGLRILRELHGRKPDFPGLKDKLAESYAARASKTFDGGRYADGRAILKDAESLAPGHGATRAVRARFVDLASRHRDRAKKLEGPARLDAYADALRVWPTVESVEGPYREAFAAWPTLDVGVTDVPRQVGPWVRSPADERVSRLLYLPVLSRDDEDAFRGNAPGQLAAEVTSADLGRRLVIGLREGTNWSDGSRPVSSVDLYRALTDAAEPSSLRYNARWADMIDRVETTGPLTLEVRLRRPLLKPEAWLLGPVGPAHAGPDGRVTSNAGPRELVGDGPYRLVVSTPDRFEAVAVGGEGVKVRRAREFRYPNAGSLREAFDRGEVALMAHVPSDALAAVSATLGVKVGQYARPLIHQIALDGRSPALKNRALRRGLSLAIDRRGLLEEVVLGRPPDADNLVADGVFPKGDYADAPDVKPLGYDPLLARMLIAGAKKEMGRTDLVLAFEYPAIPEAQAVAPKLIEAFKRVGVDLRGVERSESELESELRGGRPFELAYRATVSEEPVVDAGPSLSPAYDAPSSTDPLTALASPRILQLLLLLERATEFPTARGLVIQIDRECRDELPVLPLWQLSKHYAWRERLKGPPETTDRLYQGIETWEVEPWFAQGP